MLYTMMLALPLTGAVLVALASVAFVAPVALAFALAFALVFAPGAHPVSVSAPASRAAAGMPPAGKSRFLGMTVLFRQGPQP
jgi:hypothetical protein